MIENLSREQLVAILDALPLEFIFIDDQERLLYANKGEKRSRPAPTDIVGKDIRDCHKSESLPLVEQFVSNLKIGNIDDIKIGMPIEVVFENINEEISLPRFRPL